MLYQHVYKFWLLQLLDQYGNFKEAANHARMTQSAFSQNLTALESVLNKSLVIRGRGSVELTDEGQELLKNVQPVLSSLDAIDPDKQDMESIKGNFKLGAYESIAVHFLPHLLKVIRKLHPELRFEVQTSRTESLLKEVRKGSLDVALVINGPSDSKLNVEKVGFDDLGLYAAADYKNPTGCGEGDCPFHLAGLSPGTDGHPLFYKKFIKKIPKPYELKISCDSFETIMGLVLSGEVVGVMPNKLAAKRGNIIKKLWPMNDEDSKLSRHYFCIVSRKNIDRKIIDLVSHELKKILE